MNSTVGPIFNEKVAEKWNLWVRKQYTMCTDWLKIVWKVKLCGYCLLNSSRNLKNAWKKKKKKEKRKRTFQFQPNPNVALVAVWIHWSCVSRLHFSFFFFFLWACVSGVKRYCSSLLWTVAATFDPEQCICALFMDPQTSLFSNFFIKNGSHGTIHTFKNYFATMFSVFSF